MWAWIDAVLGSPGLLTLKDVKETSDERVRPSACRTVSLQNEKTTAPRTLQNEKRPLPAPS